MKLTRFISFSFLVTALLLVSVFERNRQVSAGQGKGGEVVTKPTPTPKKATIRRTAPARTTNNSKTNQATKSASEAASAAEMIFWNSIKDSTNPDDFRAYLKKYPDGEFAELARNRISTLEAPKSQPSPAVTSTPAPSSPVTEPVYDWAKAEHDLPAPARLEWGGKDLSFSIPAGWIRTVREQKGDGGVVFYRQISFRAPDSPQTTVTIQIIKPYWSFVGKDGRMHSWAGGNDFVTRQRAVYSSQNVSARLSESQAINHQTGRWQTFTADVQDVQLLSQLASTLDAVYPDDVWQKDNYGTQIKAGALEPYNRTRHMYAVREADLAIVTFLYTAPIDRFDERLLPSIMSTLRMTGGKFKVYPSGASVGLDKLDPEVFVDGTRMALGDTKGVYGPYDLSVGKHHVSVRAKEHKPFEGDVVVEGWRDGYVSAKLEPITNTGGTKPN